MFRNSRTYRVLLVLMVAVAVLCAWAKPIETRANEQLDAGFRRALATFAAARALNAAISVAKSAQVGIAVANVSPGQVLDPLDDLIEEFSGLMLMASVAFAAQRALLAIGSGWAVSALITVVALAWAALHFAGKAPGWLHRVLLVLLLVRFAIPATAIGADWVYQTFQADTYEESQAVIDSTSREVEQDGGWRENVKKLKSLLEQGTERFVSLIVIFLLQSLLIPLFLLWLLKAGAGLLLHPGPAPESGARRRPPDTAA